MPYPASCRPQAWAAASAVVIVQGLLGLKPDVPKGLVRLAPSSAVGALQVSGLTVNGVPFAVSIDSNGAATSVQADPSLQVLLGATDR